MTPSIWAAYEDLVFYTAVLQDTLSLERFIEASCITGVFSPYALSETLFRRLNMVWSLWIG